MTYTEIKNELKRRCESTKYFTRDFYNIFLESKKKFNETCTAEHFDPVIYTDFYLKNSPAYCEFLSIYNESLPKFEIQLTDEWNNILHSHCDRYPDKKVAENWVRKRVIPYWNEKLDYDFRYFNIIQIA